MKNFFEFLGYWVFAMMLAAVGCIWIWIANQIRLSVGDNWATFLLVSFVLAVIMFALRNGPGRPIL